MFIQSQQLVTSSSSGAVQPKKRKSEHYNTTTSEEFLHHQQQQQDQQSHHQQDLVYLNAVNGSTTQIIDLNHATSPNNNQQPFVRASTIKLLDTYQRCGQKVRTFKISTTILFLFLKVGVYTYYLFLLWIQSFNITIQFDLLFNTMFFPSSLSQ